MKCLLFSVFLGGVMLFVSGCGNPAARRNHQGGFILPETTTGAQTAAGMWLIDYSIEGGKLSYAVINGPSSVAHGHSGMGGDSQGNLWAYLYKPDGTKISIRGSGRIFFVSGTNVVECSRRISGKIFQAFLDSTPSDYSMPALLNFAARHE